MSDVCQRKVRYSRNNTKRLKLNHGREYDKVTMQQSKEEEPDKQYPATESESVRESSLGNIYHCH